MGIGDGVEFGYNVCTDSSGIDGDVGFGGGAGIGSGGIGVSISSVIPNLQSWLVLGYRFTPMYHCT